MVHPQDQLPMDEVTSPLGAQLLEFCESELFPETMQNSEVASSSNCCYERQQSSYQTHPNMNKYNNGSSSIDTEIKQTAPLTPITNFSLDPLENNISASIEFTTTPSSFSLPHHQYLNNTNDQEQPFSISSLNNPLSLGDLVDGPRLQYEPLQGLGDPHQQQHSLVQMVGPIQIPTPSKDEFVLPSYIQLRTSMDPMIEPYLTSGSMSAPPFSGESSTGIFVGPGLILGNGLSHQDLEFQGDSGLFLPDAMPRVFNSELQALSNESQHLFHGSASSTTPLATEISSLEDPTCKVGKLSVEEKKMKIYRYKKKRNERNFSKKIKYACRKTLADSRPRVRGRFAKNDEQGEIARTNGSNHEYDDTDEVVSLYSNHQRKVGVKVEEDMDSSDIFAHISGVNSFKCGYPIQSWI